MTKYPINSVIICIADYKRLYIKDPKALVVTKGSKWLIVDVYSNYYVLSDGDSPISLDISVVNKYFVPANEVTEALYGL
jgi:hypothetical protein